MKTEIVMLVLGQVVLASINLAVNNDNNKSNSISQLTFYLANYAPTIMPQVEAAKAGYSQVS